MPKIPKIPLADVIDRAVKWFTTTFGDSLDTFSDNIKAGIR